MLFHMIGNLLGIVYINVCKVSRNERKNLDCRWLSAR